jgi:hypothetical protein
LSPFGDSPPGRQSPEKLLERSLKVTLITQGKPRRTIVNMMAQNMINMNSFKLPSSISLIQGGEMIYGEYLAKMENCIWTIGYTKRNSSDFAICVVDSDYERAKQALKDELIRLGQFN